MRMIDEHTGGRSQCTGDNNPEIERHERKHQLRRKQRGEQRA